MIFTVKIDNYIVRAKYWPAEPSTGTPADVELLRVWEVYEDRKIELPYEGFYLVNERRVMQKVNEALLEESREAIGDGFNFYNPYSKQYETR